MKAKANALAFLGLALAPACVPSGSAPPYDAGTSATSTASAFRPSLNVMTTPFEDNFDRDAAEWAPVAPSSTAMPPASASASSSAEAAAALRDAAIGHDAAAREHEDAGKEAEEPDAERFQPSNLGPNWLQAKTTAWHVENGKLCGQNAHNHGVWLNRTLPVNARIEFDAVTSSDDGDLKGEFWGDGKSFATGTSYTNATSYLVILGGWHNTLHVIARLNEHGADRQVLPVDPNSDDPRQRPVVKGQAYHFKVERTDGKTIRWFVDGVEYLKWTDPAPLAGEGHDHFAFNDWEAKVCFDNVKVTPL